MKGFCPECLTAHPRYAACVPRPIDMALHQAFCDDDEVRAMVYYEGMRVRWREYGMAVRRGTILAHLWAEMQYTQGAK